MKLQTKITLWLVLACLVGAALGIFIALHDERPIATDPGELTYKTMEPNVPSVDHGFSVLQGEQDRRARALVNNNESDSLLVVMTAICEYGSIGTDAAFFMLPGDTVRYNYYLFYGGAKHISESFHLYKDGLLVGWVGWFH
jgi:hypothetical protein